jgi:hypothetical protein
MPLIHLVAGPHVGRRGGIRDSIPAAVLFHAAVDHQLILGSNKHARRLAWIGRIAVEVARLAPERILAQAEKVVGVVIKAGFRPSGSTT